MSEFKVGDKVRTNVPAPDVPAGSIGTIVGGTSVYGEVRVEFPSLYRRYYLAVAGEVELVAAERKFVNVIEARTIWVTLPGDNAGHKLTEDEAQALFRQLEEIL